MKERIFCLVFFLGVLTVVKAQETYTWHNVAMGGGGFVTGIVTSAAEQDLVYARTDVGGAYRWNEAMESWHPLLDWVAENEVGYLGVESIAIDPHAPNKVYMLVGTSYFNNGKTAILRSNDYGNTFSITDVTSLFKAHGNGMGRQTGEKLVVDPNSTNILFCGTRSNGLFKSTNAGVSWSRVSALNVTTTHTGNGISFVMLDPASGSDGNATQTIIAGVSREGDNLYRSDDGGATFSVIEGAPSTLMPHRAAMTHEGMLYITYASNAGPWDITEPGAIWKYDLSNGEWTNVSPEGFTGSFGGISIDPQNPLRVVASSINTYMSQEGSWGDRIFLSNNGGATWVDVVQRGFDLDPNGITWVDGHAIHWAGSIEFDPFNTNRVWIVSGNGVFRTEDIDAANNVWKFQVKGMEETVPLDLVSIGNGPLVSVIADYDGFRHFDVTDYAHIHQPQMGTTTGIAVAHRNPNVMIRTGGNLYHSTDMGATWTEGSAEGPNGTVAVSADGTVLLHCPEGKSLYRSEDLALTWHPVEGVTTANVKPVADPVNEKKFYVYNYLSGEVLVSTDGGVTFVSAAMIGMTASKNIRTAPGREGDLWVPLNGNGLVRSINSAQSFSVVESVASCTAIGFGKEAPGASYPTIYIWGNVNGVTGVHRSTDEGVSWLRINDDDHEFGGTGNGQFVMGDMNVYGRVYMSTVGRGIVYGESSEACIPDRITPMLQVNGEQVEDAFIINVAIGDDIELAAESATNGTWQWEGPDGFHSDQATEVLPDIQTAHEGIYTVYFTNEQGCKGAGLPLTVNVVIPAQSIHVTGVNGANRIDEKGGSLQMTALFFPSNTSNQSVVWSIVSDEELASISPSGVLTALHDGVVTVRATAADGTGVYGEADVIIINQVITSAERPVSHKFVLYPNPTRKEIFIEDGSLIRRIEIIDMLGVKRKTYKYTEPGHVLRISLEQLPVGYYFIKLNTKGGTVVERVIVE